MVTGILYARDSRMLKSKKHRVAPEVDSAPMVPCSPASAGAPTAEVTNISVGWRGLTRFVVPISPSASESRRWRIFTSKVVLALLCFLPLSLFAQSSWTGAVSTDWHLAGNWTAGVPTATVDAIIGDTNFAGPNQPSISSAAASKSLTLGTGTRTTTLSVSRSFTISGDILIGANGTLSQSGATISVMGNWNKVGSYIGSNASTVVLSGASQSIIGATTFSRLTIAAGSTTILEANIVVTGQLNVNGVLDPNELPT